MKQRENLPCSRVGIVNIYDGKLLVVETEATVAILAKRVFEDCDANVDRMSCAKSSERDVNVGPFELIS